MIFFNGKKIRCGNDNTVEVEKDGQWDAVFYEPHSSKVTSLDIKDNVLIANCFDSGETYLSPDGINWFNGQDQVDSPYAQAGVKSPIVDSVTKGIYPVDLGLSVRWASCNIGATTPEEHGSIFRWGLPGVVESENDLKEYDTSVFPDNICGTQFDMARAALGDCWRLPTAYECTELSKKCKLTSSETNRCWTSKYTAPNGNSIVIPCGQEQFLNYSPYINYCSGNLDKNRDFFDCVIGLFSSCNMAGQHFLCNTGSPIFPYSNLFWIRAVEAKPSDIREAIKLPSTANKKYDEVVDLGLSTLWASCNMGASSPEEDGKYYKSLNPSEFSEYGLLNILPKGNDIAQNKLGKAWHIPTVKEFTQLTKQTHTILGTFKGKKGIKYIGMNGNAIFIPFRNDRPLEDRHGHQSSPYWDQSSFLDNRKPEIFLSALGYSHKQPKTFQIRPVKEREIQGLMAVTEPPLIVSDILSMISITIIGTIEAKNNLHAGIIYGNSKDISLEKGKIEEYNLGIVTSTEISNQLEERDHPKNFLIERADDRYNFILYDLLPTTKYYYRAFVNVDGKYHYGEVKEFVTAAPKRIDSFNEVDLGLSVNWGDITLTKGYNDEYNYQFLLDPLDEYDEKTHKAIDDFYKWAKERKYLKPIDSVRKRIGRGWRWPTPAEMYEQDVNCKREDETGIITGVTGQSLRHGHYSPVKDHEKGIKTSAIRLLGTSAAIDLTAGIEELDGINKVGIIHSQSPEPNENNGTICIARTYISNLCRWTIVITGLEPETKYYYRPFSVTNGKLNLGEIKDFVTKAYETAPEAVDLGLSVDWASCNFGAKNPIENGYEFNKDKTLFRIHIRENFDLIKSKLGYGWHIPTDEEYKEFHDKCKIHKNNMDGEECNKATGPNGNSIYLPLNYNRTSFGYGNDFIRPARYRKPLNSEEDTGNSNGNRKELLPDSISGIKTLNVEIITSEIYCHYAKIKFYILDEIYLYNSTEYGIITSTTPSIDDINKKVYKIKIGQEYRGNFSYDSYVFENGVQKLEEDKLPLPLHRPLQLSRLRLNDFILDNLEPCTTYYYAVFVNFFGETVLSEIKSFTTEKEVKPEAVDLGLNVKWASFDVASCRPEQKGLSPTELFYHECWDLKAIWGKEWRLPEPIDFLELSEKCSFEKTILNGKNVYIVTGPSGKSIILSSSCCYSTIEGHRDFEILRCDCYLRVGPTRMVQEKK
jgi:hypothetical protein